MSELKRYAVEYGDDTDGYNIGTWYTKAYSAEHALEKFQDASEDDGFVAQRIALSETGMQRHKLRWFLAPRSY